MGEIAPYTRVLWTEVLSKICKTVGLNTAQTVGLQILLDVAHKYLREICLLLHGYVELSGRTHPVLEDVLLVFQELNISLSDLHDYAVNVTPMPLNIRVPKYPVNVPSNLRFLKPGSKEVVTRPVYIHEHLPPMYSELDESSIGIKNAVALPTLSTILDDTTNTSSAITSLSQGSDDAKAKSTGDNSSLLVRELRSVLMTTWGFLSPAREGKLPEAKIPKVPSQKVKTSKKEEREHKSKRSSKTVNKDVEKKRPAVVPEKLTEDSGGAIKLSVPIKDVDKLKILKPLTVTVPDIFVEGTIEKKIVSENRPVPRNAEIKDNNNKRFNKVVKRDEPVFEPSSPPPPPRILPPPPPPVEKLPTQPDKAKMSIFKKITKRNRVEKKELPPVPCPPPSPPPPPPVLFEEPEYKHRSPLLWLDDTYEQKKERRIKEEVVLPIEKEPKILEDLPFKKKMKKEKHKRKYDEAYEGVDEDAEKRELKKMKKKKRKDKKKDDDFVQIKREDEDGMMLPSEQVYDERSASYEEAGASDYFSSLPYPYYSNLPSTSSMLPSSLLQNPLIPRFAPFHTFGQPPNMMTRPSMTGLPFLPPSSSSSVNNLYLTEDRGSSMQDSGRRYYDSSVYNDNAEESFTPVEEYRMERKRSKKDKADAKQKKRLEREQREQEKEKQKLKDERRKEKLVEKEKVKVIKRKHQPYVEASVTASPIPPPPVASIEATIPKLKLKLASSASPKTPAVTRSPKITIKPIVKDDNEERKMDVSKKWHVPPEPKRSKHKSSLKAPMATISPVAQTQYHPVEPITISVGGKLKKDKAEKMKVKSKDKDKKGKSGKKESMKKMDARPPAYYFDDVGNQIWLCPSCGEQDDGSPMIGCDGCDAWYHWVCVGIEAAPESAKWFCPYCRN